MNISNFTLSEGKRSGMNNKIFLLKSFKSHLQSTGFPIPSKRPKQGVILQCSGEDIQQMLDSICHIS